MKTKIFILFILAAFTAAAQTPLKVTQPIRYYKQATYDVAPIIPYGSASNNAVPKSYVDSIKIDTVQIRSYISGTAGTISKFKGDSAVVNATRGVDYISGNKSQLRTIRRLGGGIVTWGIGSEGAWSATYTLVDAQLTGYLLEPIEKDTTITGIYYTLQATGSFTGVDTCSIAVYELDNVTLTKVAEGAPSASIFKITNNTKGSIAFAATYTMKANKLYYVCWLYNNSAQTTAPTFYYRSAFGGSIGKFLTGGVTKLGFAIPAQASLPETITLTDGQSQSAITPSIWVY